MPGSVANADVGTPARVLPQMLATAWRHARVYPVEVNEYAGGESQRAYRGTSSRKRWELAVRLTAAALVALREFYESCKGPLEAFYFYDPFDVADGQVIGSNWDASGANVTGRYVVRFAGGWDQSMGLARGDAGVALVELA